MMFSGNVFNRDIEIVIDASHGDERLRQWPSVFFHEHGAVHGTYRNFFGDAISEHAKSDGEADNQAHECGKRCAGGRSHDSAPAGSRNRIDCEDNAAMINAATTT